jgi:23S rRNA (pseudouridine1915-N3)-methyltransferase
VKLKIICIGKTKKGFISNGIKDYTTRIKHYISMEWIEIQPSTKSRSSRHSKGLRLEAERIREHIHDRALKVILADGGKEFSSSDFAKWLERQMIEGRQEIDFILGGDQGLDQAVFSEADLCLSLSRMTFTHQMVRLILLEQIYRAFTIIRGEPYHHG